MELANNPRVLSESNSLNRYIDLIPLRLQTTKINQQSSVQTKYSHLVSSMKPIQLLISKYRQKINSFIKDLETKHRIKDIARQIQLYSERANIMQQLDKELDIKVQKEKQIEDQRKKTVKQIRDKLNLLKIQNAKIAYEIELEDIKLLQLNKKQHQSYIRKKLMPLQTQQEKMLRDLQQEQISLQKQFFSKVHQKIQINNLIIQGFKQARKQLKKSQKKCHQKGLVGSLIFKLSQPQKQNKPHQQLRMNGDFKSLIYNTLQKKYKQEMNKSKQQKIEVEQKRFQQFNHSQTVGILALKPQSFEIIKYVVDLRIKDILLHYEQIK